MNEDSKELLRECNSGCKNATNSMEQVLSLVKDEALRKLIEDYDKKHIALGEECHRLLEEGGEEEKDPSAAAKVFSWLGTEMKLMTDTSGQKIAALMMDGCAMGIKSIGAARNHYSCASPESIRSADHLIDTELNFMKDLLRYL